MVTVSQELLALVQSVLFLRPRLQVMVSVTHLDPNDNAWWHVTSAVPRFQRAFVSDAGLQVRIEPLLHNKSKTTTLVYHSVHRWKSLVHSTPSSSRDAIPCVYVYKFIYVLYIINSFDILNKITLIMFINVMYLLILELIQLIKNCM